MKAEKRQQREEPRRRKKFFASLRLSSHVFTSTGCSTDSPVTCCEPVPGNKAPNYWHPKLVLSLMRANEDGVPPPTSTKLVQRCHQRSARAERPAAKQEPNQAQHTCVMAHTSHTHTSSDSPKVAPASRQGVQGKAGTQVKLVNRAPFLITDGKSRFLWAIRPTSLGHKQLDNQLREGTCLLDSLLPHITPSNRPEFEKLTQPNKLALRGAGSLKGLGSSSTALTSARESPCYTEVLGTPMLSSLQVLHNESVADHSTFSMHPGLANTSPGVAHEFSTQGIPDLQGTALYMMHPFPLSPSQHLLTTAPRESRNTD